MSASSPLQSPRTPSSTISSNSSRHTFGAPTSPALHQYSDALRRVMEARFQAVARAGSTARLPDDAAHDPDYGYDEDPFDTRARLLQSFDVDGAPRSSESSSSEPTVDGPPTPEPKPAAPLDNLNAMEVTLNSPINESFLEFGAMSSASYPSSLDPGSALMSRSASYNGCDTPSSEASFEAGRASDYLSLYGRPRSPAQTPSSIGSARFRQQLTPLTPVTPGSRRRRYHPYTETSCEWDEAVLTRTTSETMLLAAGLGAQRHRRRRADAGAAAGSGAPQPPAQVQAA